MRNSKKVESKGIVKDKKGGHKGLVSPGTLTSSRGVCQGRGIYYSAGGVTGGLEGAGATSGSGVG